MRFELKRYGRPDADTLLFQMVDDHDLEVIEREVSHVRELSGGQDFCLTAVKVNNWNQDLSPWPVPAVFGNEDFGDGTGRKRDPEGREHSAGCRHRLHSGMEQRRPLQRAGSSHGKSFCVAHEQRERIDTLFIIRDRDSAAFMMRKD